MGGFAVLSWSGSRTIVLAGAFVLAALALHPFPPVERAVDLLFVPARFARELLRPLGWFSMSEVRATLAHADDAFALERESSRELLAAQIEAALPLDARLRANRAFLVAEVLERDPDDSDLLRVRFPPGSGVEVDMPVVQGDSYVGRVREVDRRRAGEGVVELVTDERHRVGAVVRDDAPEPAGIVVGGLVEARARRGSALLLGARFESRPVSSGAVVVGESTVGPRAERRARADGFRLGKLRVISDRGRSILGVETAFDYAHGLSAVAIVGGPELAADGPLFADDAFDDARWTSARIALAGDSSPRRRTRHLTFDDDARVEVGAALGLGARFVGRVVETTEGRAIAALLGDPALEFGGVAALDGRRGPLQLGRLRSLGYEADGSVLLEWNPRDDVALTIGPVSGPARIATAAGDRGVPAGLWVGSCVIPEGPGPHVLRLVPLQNPADLLRVRVRVAPIPVEEGP